MNGASFRNEKQDHCRERHVDPTTLVHQSASFATGNPVGLNRKSMAEALYVSTRPFTWSRDLRARWREVGPAAAALDAARRQEIAAAQTPRLRMAGIVRRRAEALPGKACPTVPELRRAGAGESRDACASRAAVPPENSRFLPDLTGRTQRQNRRCNGSDKRNTACQSQRRLPESNRCKRLCRPLRSHSAKAPRALILPGRPAAGMLL